MKYMYVAGPYSSDPAQGIQDAVEIANGLWDEFGIIAYVPHLTHLWHLITPREYEFWISYGLEWVRKCDALFRIEGESPGADKEVALARELGKPIFTDFYQIEKVL
jgi:hypothetical protein